MLESARKTAVLLAAFTLLMSPAASQAMAAGDGPGGSNQPTPASPPPAPKCKDGEVWDPDAPRLFGKGKCVAEADVGKGEKQGLIYDYGKSLAHAGDFEGAIRVLAMAPDKSDPRVLNYMGYAHRKLGRLDEALVHYRAAVAADPDFTLVREYLGEAYVQLGLLEKAREQLSEIERICGGRECGEYRELATVIVESQLAE